ncbi:LacI family DNA-binding transcriptional regulator [Ohessyouella blattaphilus]|uniref:LacI family DNA-binding transcriptional regulator n=1 Tax=Ohessyouella blattaphilus TaxID=2949333 RepID=A0ABT1EL17_9FIRM|nr:LacI family DNA-binding transcriptional regulator [Ohessyouella blattaphilus]MCP1111400.1 LacI family DNA-binding transcriptional regulator [Ohessyouella blattaphilus]MCR8564794.1 LacI family DNA-binding transcriptional regulator [Ohessyouella blattaphilus]
MAGKINIKKISEVTGFSPATVSNALNNKRGVNRDTAAEILRVAKELGYISENRITKIRFVIYKRNGKIIDDTPFFPLLIDGVETECKRLGYEMSISNLDKRDDDYEEQVRWLINDTSSAIIFLGTELMENDIDIYRSSKCPFLIFDCFESSMPFDGVLINNADSARMATEYLIDKGHRKIGYLRGDFRIKAFRSRAVGYARTLNNHGIEVNREYTHTLDTTMEGAYEDMKKVLAKKQELPTAFFADNDVIAIGAMKALQEYGYKVPEDISIIGFDDLPFCEITTPRLTTIRVSKQEMGMVAVRRMDEMIKMPGKSKLKISICTEFVERDSVRMI